MGSNRTGKTSTGEHQRVPSTVPNDYNHLGVPTEVNMPLNATRRKKGHARRRRSRMPNWMKALLALAGAGLAVAVVGLVIFAIAFPPFFRSLEPRYQQRLINMFPPFDALRPTVPFQVIPTVSGGSSSDAAQQLLFAEEETATPKPPDDAGQDPATLQPLVDPAELATPIPTLTPTESVGGIPVGQINTPVPTMLPVYNAPTQPAQMLPSVTPIAVAAAPQAASDTPLPATYKLDLSRIRYEQQGWNNCGPTTMTMALSYYGWTSNQEVAASWMKPNVEDKNVSPWQMVRFVNDNTGVKALYRFGGTTQVLKRLLAANFPVVIEESIQPANEGWMGHYVLLIGYDDYQQEFLSFDSYLGSNQQQGRPSPYSAFDDHWRQFNRMFIVVYESSREMELRAALGEYVDPQYGYVTARDQARDEARRDREDKFAWFNMGSAYVLLKEYDNAAYAFDEALRLGLPFRMLWYQFGPYEAYLYSGRYSDVIVYANSTIGTTPYVEESYYYEGMAYAAQGETQAALGKFNEALKYNRNFFPATEAKAEVEAGTFSVSNAGS